MPPHAPAQNSAPNPNPTGAFNLRQTRALLDTLGHSPRKPLGQNFLVDANIVRKSLELAAVAPGDIVVEIGPGLGTLTAALLAAGATVFAVERDPALARHLRSWLQPRYPDNFFLAEADAVARPLAALPDAFPNAAIPPAFKVVANLPYAISTPWMDAVLTGPALPALMVVMLQREAAERFAARPESGGGKSVGAITVALDAAFEHAPGHKVPPVCFFPPPRVDSVLARLVRRAAPHRLRPETRRVLRALFLHRRKQLGSLVRHLPGKPSAVPSDWLARLPEWGLSAQARPEVIPFPAWRALDAMFADEAEQQK
jgi:16S rRNA (adenine1518-N6/adenine1519-N6)-dimethyltransferase